MDDELTVIGETNFRGDNRLFGIKKDDRRRHVYMIGKTGVGKTTLIGNMMRQDIAKGRGVALVDPHGDLAKSMLDAVPPNRVNDVIYFDPADVDYPIAFNVLQAIDPKYNYLVASGLIGVLRKIWADTWGPRLEYILRNAILAVLDNPSATMMGILRILSDDKYRKKIVSNVKDPVVKAFWTDEFANYNERFRAEAVAPVQNKVGQFLTSSVIRNIVAQPRSTLDMKDIMDNGKILILNVSKGRIGEDNSALLGAMLITHIQLAAMDRANVAEEKRKDFYLYVDEFQNFATESFATILSEARKYRLNLTIGHQYITQMEEPVRDAVFGNAGTIVSFRVGASDCEFLEKEFAPNFTENDLVNLDKYTAYIKLMIDGLASRPFSMRTVPAIGEDYELSDKVMKVSRERYGHKREIVEEKIKRWTRLDLSVPGEAGQKIQRDEQWGKREQKEKDRPFKENEKNLIDVIVPGTEKEEISDLAGLLGKKGHEAVCSRCKKKTDVPFEPVSGRPIYCRECYELVKKERKKDNQILVPKIFKKEDVDYGPEKKEAKEKEKSESRIGLTPPPLST